MSRATLGRCVSVLSVWSVVTIWWFASTGAAMAGCTDPARPGVDWLRCYHEERLLTGVDLSGARLRDARFARADMSNSNLTGIDARRAKFIAAKLSGVRLDEANLTEADFTRADLTGASFKNADLRRSRLFRANLRRADFTGARIDGADLLNADLSGATWIDGTSVCAEGSVSQCK
ncbi:MAG: pentapeptide repeat-containing protein [Sphingomonadales bacterium]